MIILTGDHTAMFADRDDQARRWHREQCEGELALLFDCVAAFEQILRRRPELPASATAAEQVLHDLVPDAYQALRAGATLLSLGMYQPAFRMARPLSEQWGIALFLTEHPGEAATWLSSGNYPNAGRLLSRLKTEAIADGDTRRQDLLNRVRELRAEENDLQHVGKVAALAGTRAVDGSRVAMLGSGRSREHTRAGAALLLRWIPGILSTALKSSGEEPGDLAPLQALYRRVEAVVGAHGPPLD